jgi:hypothetical protein
MRNAEKPAVGHPIAAKRANGRRPQLSCMKAKPVGNQPVQLCLLPLNGYFACWRIPPIIQDDNPLLILI